MQSPDVGLAVAFAAFAEDFVHALERIDDAILAMLDAMDEPDCPGGQSLTTSELRITLGEAGTDGAMEFTSEGGIRQGPSTN
jgi:hypothetical protein